MVAVTRTVESAEAMTRHDPPSANDRPWGPQRVVVPAEEPWAAEYPFASHWFGRDYAATGSAASPRAQGRVWMHYLDEGPKDAPVVVMLHGNPTWSFYWRSLVVALRDKYRCIVPDHLGMGLSDRPQEWPYTLANRVAHVRALLANLGIKKFSLVVHDWGGAIGMGVATANPDHVEKIVVTNTAAFLSQDIPLSIASVRIPVFGRVAVLRFNAFAGAATVRAVEKPLSKHAKAGLLAPYSNAHDRISTLKFVEDIPMKPTHPSWDTLKNIEDNLKSLTDKPMQLIWGDKDFCFTPKFRARWQGLFPNARVQAYDDVGHYVMEDAPERANPLIRAFLDEGRA